MNFIANHANMTADELNAEMTAFAIFNRVEFSDQFPATRENINWMVAVYAVERGLADTAEGMSNLLAAMNKHYAGPISIHEGWGGIEADSNQDLIIEKIRFDMRENVPFVSLHAMIAAVKLGWIERSELDEAIDSAIDALA